MDLEPRRWYAHAEIMAALGPDYQLVCDGQFAIAPDVVACLFTISEKAGLHFATLSRFVWRPQRSDYAAETHFPWFPHIIYENRKPFLLCVRMPDDERFFLVGPSHLSRYGISGSDRSADFSIDHSLTRAEWLRFGGSLEPRQPFAALPSAETGSSHSCYHQKTLDLLHIYPPTCHTTAAQLDMLEQQHGLVLPASVREWYSLTGSMEIMRTICMSHEPADIANYVRGKADSYASVWPHLRMLPLMFENQGVWHIAVALDAGDDPPVYLGFSEDGGFVWEQHAERFSDFVYAWAWDYVGYERDYQLIVTEHISAADIAHIKATFAAQATTSITTASLYCSRCERYTMGDQHITLIYNEEREDIFFSSESLASFERLLRGPWSAESSIPSLLKRDLALAKPYLW